MIHRKSGLRSHLQAPDELCPTHISLGAGPNFKFLPRSTDGHQPNHRVFYIRTHDKDSLLKVG